MKKPLRKEHEEFTRKCLGELNDSNAEEIRTRLRAANAALDEAEKKLESRRTAEEIQFDDSEALEMLEGWKGAKKLGETAWKQASERNPEAAASWLNWFRANSSGGYAPGFESRIGMAMLADAVVRKRESGT